MSGRVGRKQALPAFEYGSDPQLVIPDARPGWYYVTCRRGTRVGWLLGPYPNHSDAIANVDRARRLAVEVDSFASFYDIGTARVEPVGVPPRSVFGE